MCVDEQITIIGLTGPIGSGCSTLSQFLSDNIENIESFIKEVDKCTQKEIDKLYDSRYSIESFEKNNEKQKQHIEEDGFELFKNDTHSELKRSLEIRQYLNFLDDKKIKNAIGRGIKRISVSDLIVAHTIVNKDITGEDEDIKIYIEGFDKIKIKDEDRDLLKKLLKTEAYKTKQEDSVTLDNIFKKIRDFKRYLREEKPKIYRDLLQDFGDNLRRTGNPYDYSELDLGEERQKEKLKNNKDILSKNILNIVNVYNKSGEEKYNFFVVECLRNPCEVIYLRRKIPDFFLISLYADENTRKDRLRAMDSDKDFKDQDDRDSGKGLDSIEELYKQNVSECVRISDIAINNESGKEELKIKTLRYLALILEKGCTKPTKDEVCMNLAYTASMRSNCISNEVGAVITDDSGYILGVGWNDVGEGQISCGLRSIDDLRRDNFKNYIEILKTQKDEKDAEDIINQIYKNIGIEEETERNDVRYFCFKDEMARKIEEETLEGKEYSNDCEENIRKISKKFRKEIKNLQQHCKSLHAEDNAIIQSSKIGGVGLKGGTIYVNLFPCEVCAKKICQVGIKRLVFVEPYRGYSKDLFLNDGIKKIEIKHFEGVMPYSYIRLFKPDRHLKDWQELKISKLVD
ncbi:MAG: deaminase [Halobacteriota archaeon]|nr:deaminase [Halobacteriota archaeon]